jgi:drug/metabolite transporter (DMT)-like permease
VTHQTGLTLGLLATLAWGMTDILGSAVSQRIGSVATSAAAQLTSVGIVLVLFVATGTGLPREPWVVGAALACGLLSGVVYLAYFAALRLGPLSVVSPVMSVYGGLTVVLSTLLLGEALGPLQALGVAVATGGVVLTSVVVEGAGRRPQLAGRGIVYALVTVVGFAGLTVGLSAPIREVGWLPVLLFVRLANAAFACSMLGVMTIRRRSGAASPPGPRRGRAESPPASLFGGAAYVALDGASTDPAAVDPRADLGPARLDWRAVALAILVGVFDIGGFIAFVIGLQIAPTWLIGLASSYGPVIAVLAGVAIIGERPRPVQWAGLGLVFFSIFLIAPGR